MVRPETIGHPYSSPSITQKSFSDLEYAAKKKLTRRDRFLAEIDNVTPWGKLHKLIEPFYPKVEGAGRAPIGVTRMLRIYVAQQSRCPS